MNERQVGEKDQLICWIKDKIAICDEDIRKLGMHICDPYLNLIKEIKIMKDVYQEVLDFIEYGLPECFKK